MKYKLVEHVRAVKSKRELSYLIKAQRISGQVLLDAKKKLKIGVSEKEIANFIIKKFADYGASLLSFPPIVAFGKGSSDIHHEPSNTKLKKGDIVMFDIGTTINHYCSDMTRTYFFGNPTPKQKKVYLDVLKAQNMAVQKLMKGERRAAVIDAAARNFLAKKYKNNFKHGLGHGVGTVIHEWPNFKPKSPDIIPTGCVMTVEPGIYLRGFGGIRIEDMYLIGKNTVTNLTKLPKRLEDVIISSE